MISLLFSLPVKQSEKRIPRAHAEKTLFPSLNHTTSAELHREGAVTIKRGVELHAILVQVALVMIQNRNGMNSVVHGYGVAVDSLLRAIIGHELCVTHITSDLRCSE